jgi:hypothetical protein
MMVNPDPMYRDTLDHQQQLLDEAARRHLISGGSLEDARRSVTVPPWRATFAAMLRRAADRLEPAARQSEARS